jgi:hypothetical protein
VGVALSPDPKSGEDLLSLFPLLHGVAKNETITDMRGTIWAERLEFVFVGGLSEQERRVVTGPQHIALAANANQAGARRAEILVEYTEDSGLLPLLIEHSFNWIRQRQPAPTKGDFFTDR